ncbi:MAG: class I adenylate-forming enzyme family protein [Acidimicrobiales bacterium]
MVDLQADQLRSMANAYPDEVAYRNLTDGSSITFDRWERQSNRLAHGLRGRGIGKGDLVALWLEAGHILDFIVTYTAVHRLGAVAVPMNNRLSPPEARDILEHAEVRALVASGSLEAAVHPSYGSLPSLSLVATVATVYGSCPEGTAGLEEVKSADDSPIQEPLTGEDLADVMYTSGTTGRPKGVAVRHGNVALLPNTSPVWQGSAWLTATPVFTLAGLGFVYNPMKAGMTVLYLPRFDAGTWLDVVERERPVIAFVVPAMAQLLTHHPRFDTADLSSLKRVILGSAPLSAPTLLRLQERLAGAAVLNSYGMTEGGHATFSMDPDGARTHPGAVGRPRPSVEVEVVDDGGVACPLGTVGEVVTRYPSGHREYYKDPEATARMWADGWLHTGDLGYLDADGYLYIVGRKKEMIVRGGMNVYADHVESALHAHPAVVEAAVIGVPHEVLGEDVAAFVVRGPGSSLSADELRQFAGERLADYKVPRRITFVEELPRNAGGKVLKSRLAGVREEAGGAAGSSGGGAT